MFEKNEFTYILRQINFISEEVHKMFEDKTLIISRFQASFR